MFHAKIGNKLAFSDHGYWRVLAIVKIKILWKRNVLLTRNFENRVEINQKLK